MSRNRVIGKDQKLPWQLPDEFAYFRRTTLNNPVIMGRKTFDSMDRRPLPKRLNIVVTRQPNFAAEGVSVVNSVDEGIQRAQETRADMGFVIGGSKIYESALPQSDLLFQTIIDTEIDGDVLFPEFDRNDWRVVSSAFHGMDARHAYSFEMSVLARV